MLRHPQSLESKRLGFPTGPHVPGGWRQYVSYLRVFPQRAVQFLADLLISSRGPRYLLMNKYLLNEHNMRGAEKCDFFYTKFLKWRVRPWQTGLSLSIYISVHVCMQI